MVRVKVTVDNVMVMVTVRLSVQERTPAQSLGTLSVLLSVFLVLS